MIKYYYSLELVIHFAVQDTYIDVSGLLGFWFIFEFDQNLVLGPQVLS